MEPFLVSLALALFLLLLTTETMPAELAALLFLLVFMFLSLLPTGWHFISLDEALSGFANSAVLTIGAMFVMSAGLSKTGVVEALGSYIIRVSGSSQLGVLALSSVTVAGLSTFINNTPIVVLFVPLVLRICYEKGYSPAKLLIPISYASILGGTCTLVGTSTNLLIASVVSEIARNQPDTGLYAFGLYEITPVGIPIAVSGLLLIIVFSNRLLPDRKRIVSNVHDRGNNLYVTEFKITEQSTVIGKTVREAFAHPQNSLVVLEVLRGEEILYAPCDDVVIKADDQLIVQGTINAILHVRDSRSADFSPDLAVTGIEIAERNITLAELVILPGSRFIYSTLEQAQLKRRYGISVMAIQRRGQHIHTFSELSKLRLRLGDVLLVQGTFEAILNTRNAENLLLLEGTGDAVYNRRKAPLAAGIFLAVIAGATLNLLPIVVLALAGAAAMILTNCLTPEDGYKSLNAPVLLLIATSIGIGTIVQNTGTALVYANYITDTLLPLGPLFVLAGLFILTTLLTEFISNNASAVLMTHIAVATALQLGLSPLPFIMAVLFGASACFATPIGYQTNLFVYGPGGYKFSDFFRLGILMNLLVFIVGIILIPLVWPLTAL